MSQLQTFVCVVCVTAMSQLQTFAIPSAVFSWNAVISCCGPSLRTARVQMRLQETQHWGPNTMFWDVTPWSLVEPLQLSCSVQKICLENRGGRCVRNVVTYLSKYTASRPGKPSCWHSSLHRSSHIKSMAPYIGKYQELKLDVQQHKTSKNILHNSHCTEICNCWHLSLRAVHRYRARCDDDALCQYYVGLACLSKATKSCSIARIVKQNLQELTYHATTRQSMDGFSQNLIPASLNEMCPNIQILVRTEETSGHPI